MDSSPPFTFLPPPPPPPPPPPSNPNPTVFPPYHHRTSSTPSDLHTTLSALKHLINLSKTTIQSVSNLFPTAAATTTTTTATCPYNSNHRIPPTSLFHHHLHCPSSPAPIDLALIESLKSSRTLVDHKSNSFTESLPNDANTDLRLSLNDHRTSLDSNFFYRGCPAVVTFPLDNNNNDNADRDRIVTLPVVISVECENSNSNSSSNSIGDGNVDMRGIIDGLIRSCSYIVELLPSEYWNVRNEISHWNDYPRFYSYGVLRSVVCNYMSEKECLREWLVVNSPFYGVVIDEFMRDHILLLFRVCLKAMAREAIGHMVSISRGEPTGGKDCFECPVLVRVLAWLASQLAILYGEVNGKVFAINMLKQSLLIASSKSLFLSGEKKVGESSGLDGGDGKFIPFKGRDENDGKKSGMVFVSQVAAAVAALHERSVIETRIRAIRASRSVPAYQRVQEHQYISKKAEEERRKRPDYRPIIEHDGVLWQRGESCRIRCDAKNCAFMAGLFTQDFDANKNKSREELLAEERDYKRRRMSYRGKKMKRSTTQVMKGIIDEYMDEIKHANMAGQPPIDVTNLNNDETSIVAPISSKANKAVPQSLRKESATDISIIPATSEDEIKEKSNNHRHDGQHPEYYTTDESRYGREYVSKNADGRRSSSRSRDHGQRDEQKRPRKYHPSSPDRHHSSRARDQVSRRRDKVHENVDRSDSRERRKHEEKRPSIGRNEFDDRYDPSKSNGMDEDDV
ncbi:hypothetical protein OSB04_025734 [Centaurea solstitialis]|uniref:CHHC U11-48K-type domain-containing protein n=1 Tax=Centaurea solstitialis TaxID=347529 RepID=A0AA38T727_9ASTR|nr:hypothetical protein OSB04_025734 [Centaurea solstitialis]